MAGLTPPDEAAPVLVAAEADGSVCYRLPAGPATLPAVRRRDLLAAWDAARDGARAARPGRTRRFLFPDAPGIPAEFVLTDRDARCWAEAVERVAPLRTCYGVSLCLRLLALVDLLARAAWAAPLVAIEQGLARLHPSLLRLAAAAPLLPDARFDEAGFRAVLAPHA